MSLRQKAISAINKHGALLVFPLDNKKEPLSIWSALYPRTKMKWEWDEDGDGRVFSLWSLREELSRSRQVVYSKWYKGRATFFSREVFVSLMSLSNSRTYAESLRSSDTRNILEILETDSPLSTKELKAAAELQGKLLESQYNRAIKPLWEKFLVVGFGEKDDSSFPSLMMGATRNIYEELWQQAEALSKPKAEAHLRKVLGPENLFFKYALKLLD